MFAPTDTPYHAYDPENGTSIVVRGTSELETKTVTVKFSDGRQVRFGLGIESKPSVTDSSGLSIGLSLGELNRLAKFRNGTRSENTDFVRYVLSGLSVVQRNWPVAIGARFHTDRDHEVYKNRDLHSVLDFDPPSENEIENL